MSFILSADLGGTKTLLQLSEIKDTQAIKVRTQQFDSNAFSQFDDMLSAFLDGEAISRACFAVAGPVTREGTHQLARITNLPWLLDNQQLEKSFRIEKLQIINDFQAIGYAIDELSTDKLVCLQAGEPDSTGARAIIGAGTGLGQAYMQLDGDRYHVFATEGGHTDFAPNDDLQASLYHFLQRRFGHVSYERVLSGSGLVNIYDFLSSHFPERRDTALDEQMKRNDPAAVISGKALGDATHLAGDALRMFVKIYGAQAGNMALNYRSNGGVFIAGGIAAKILPYMQEGIFINAFNDKGRMRPLTETCPVYLICEPEIGLLGAENYALNYC